MVCLCRRCPSPCQVPHRTRRSPGSSWQVQVARLQPAWHQKRGLADTAGQQRVPAGGPQKWQEEDGDQVARAPEGRAGSHGEVQELRFFCALFFFFLIVKYT